MKRDTFPPYMTAAGFEPAKLTHKILSLAPLTRLGNAVFGIHDGIRTRNLQIRSLTRYPVAPHGQYAWSGI